MRDWISDLLLFSAGIAGGYLITNIKPYFRATKQQRIAMVAARTRILADVKERHEEEILHEALRTTEAIRGELNKSLQTLRKTLAAQRIAWVEADPLSALRLRADERCGVAAVARLGVW